MITKLTNETLDLLIKIFTIFGSIAGIIALFITYREHLRKKPILESRVQQAYFKVTEHNHNQKEKILIRVEFMVNNSGALGTSITGCIGYLRYNQAYVQTTSEPVFDAIPEEDVFPIHIKPDSSEKFTLSFLFDVKGKVDFLDRCNVPIDLFNPKKLDFKDLPILTRFMFKHTKGKFEIRTCIYREDTPESKEKRYFYPVDEAMNKFEFYPKNKYDSIL